MKEELTTPVLTDEMVATLEAFLPGGHSAGVEGDILKAAIAEALTRMEQRLAISSHTPQSPEQFQALSAARQAVQGGVLAWQLRQAGQSTDQ